MYFWSLPVLFQTARTPLWLVVGIPECSLFWLKSWGTLVRSLYSIYRTPLWWEWISCSNSIQFISALWVWWYRSSLKSAHLWVCKRNSDRTSECWRILSLRARQQCRHLLSTVCILSLAVCYCSSWQQPCKVKFLTLILVIRRLALREVRWLGKSVFTPCSVHTRCQGLLLHL